jgi:D-glycero-D-manno-heptose 1,7-bisphosphate phosphatase
VTRSAVFVDRDGVLIDEVGHLARTESVRLIPGAAAAVRRLRAAGHLVIVITNQSAIARGLLTEELLAVVHDRMRAELAREGAVLDDLFYCPHHPSAGISSYAIDCACRKPAPGMLFQARDRHDIDLANSFLVGDKRSDVAAAHRAGCRAILVRTGHGAAEEAAGFAKDERPDYLCADLTEATDWVLGIKAAIVC